MKADRIPRFFWCLLLLATASAQITSSAPQGNAPGAPAQPSVEIGMGQLLAQVEQAAQAAALDLAKLRIEKWKTDGGTKQQLEQNSGSLQRNLTAALPAIVTQVRSNPDSFASAFKLYRNLQALYDVFVPLAQAAEMFASRSEFQALNTDLGSLDSARRSLGEYLERMALMRDSEMARLRSQMRQAQAAANAAPPKKIVVDENEPAKKPARKKKPVPKPPEGAQKQ
jgi:hypothetical protein